MTEVKQIYKCEVCGNIVEVVHRGGGTLTCCGESMKLMVDNSVDAAIEKHLPIIENINGGVIIRVGEVEHPMLEEHYIEWIEAHTANKVYKKCLKPGEKPEVIFKVDEDVLFAREYCNVHGLWKK